jgi:chromosome partitioning protein
MKTFLVANPKGGSGKTTLATNLAGYFANRGRHVVLSDLDRQASSLSWLERRAEKNIPFIHALNARGGNLKSLSAQINIIDSPAGLRGEKLSEAVKVADWVIVPMQPSIFDTEATKEFLAVLQEEKAVRKGRTFVAVVGVRVDGRSKAARNLEDYLAESGFPIVGFLRNAQAYVRAAEEGLSIFDMPPSRVTKDLQQWSSLLQWMRVNDKKA